MAFTDRLHNRGSISTGYDIDNSMALDYTRNMWIRTANAYTSVTATSSTTGTFSYWFKQGRISGLVMRHGGFGNSARYNTWGMGSSGPDEFAMYLSADSSASTNPTSTRYFRDNTGWRHVVVRFDTTNGTAADRLRVYVNGEQIAWNTAPSYTQNGVVTALETGSFHGWGEGYGYPYSSNPPSKLDGYLAEIYFIDGQSLAPTEFAETNADGQWVPIEYDGTFGNRGYHLDFEDSTSSSTTGNDVSGNGNHFTNVGANHGPTYAIATDTPTNNFCNLDTLSGFIQSDHNAFTGHGLLMQGGANAYNACIGTIGIKPVNSSVKWYWECRGTANAAGSGNPMEGSWGLQKESRMLDTNPLHNVTYNDGLVRYLSAHTSGNTYVLGVLFDCTTSNPNLTLYANGSSVYTVTSGIDENETFYPYFSAYNGEITANFGGAPLQEFGGTNGNADANGYGGFVYSVPSGAYALCTKNIGQYGA